VLEREFWKLLVDDYFDMPLLFRKSDDMTAFSELNANNYILNLEPSALPLQKCFKVT
jgi:hypothetical protein